GVLEAIAAVTAKAGADPSGVERFVHGMTVATNALLETRGARTALVTTSGFEDVLEIARQDRPELYRLCAPKPEPLVAEGDRVGAGGRIGPKGEVEPLPEADPKRVAEAIAGLEVEAVAISLLFSYVDPSHERQIASAIRVLLPDVHISASHEVLPRFREYERTSTTVIDAYLSPLLGGYLEKLAEATGEVGLPEPEIMRSSGGVAPWREAAGHGSWSVLSGPAGGAVGAGLVARQSGAGSAVGLDMGGTSCDVCVIEDGHSPLSESREIAGRVIQLPMVDVHTVGAGGGSIGWVDHGGALRVGPRSAGADPGPACYGRGGDEPTVTDANLVLGRLAAGSNLAGDLELDADAASHAVAGLGSNLGLSEVETANGIVRLANAEMVRALRVVTVNRGIDPRDLPLLPFGGAGSMHAAELAEEVGMKRLICPRTGGVLSALGLLASGRRRDTARTVMLRSDDLEAARIASAVSQLRESLAEGMGEHSETVTYELRYEGQSFELDVEAGATPDPDELRSGFAEAHERRYGFDVPDAPVELVAIRLALAEEAPEPELEAADGSALVRYSRKVRFGEEWLETAVVRGEPAAGETFEGPALLELPESTLVLPPGWRAEVDEHGSVIADREPSL
ncbi:MAG TPA: hydantoinase/oxoprolinase family protein, partial [Solirubrobacterales bacterium]|nr:hydantoinase/oxoprolinase family protein [Solirubrobacterales bacterium]